ncbi:MAG TPA: hypothetical protein DEA66_07065, partial [Flavobacteriales bacterium]|nr:hypothetical protein [Flavobacteriales bacterium]
PLLLQKLLTAAFAQQQDYTHMISRRTAIWRGGGWGGPVFDPLVAPSASASTPTLPQGAAPLASTPPLPSTVSWPLRIHR